MFSAQTGAKTNSRSYSAVKVQNWHLVPVLEQCSTGTPPVCICEAYRVRTIRAGVHRYWSWVPPQLENKSTRWETRIEIPTSLHRVIEEKPRFGFVCRGTRGMIVNMVDIKGKTPADRKTDDGIAYTKRTLRLCIRCKVEMTRKDCEAIIHEKKLYGEWKEFMAFPEEWADILEAENNLKEGSEEAFNDSEQEVDSVKDKRDLLMQKDLNDYYNSRREERNGRWSYLEKPFESQQRFPGYRPNWQRQARSRPEPKFEEMIEWDIEFLGRRLINELGIQPWPRPWESREILREHLRTIKVLSNVPVDQWHKAKVSAKWHELILTKNSEVSAAKTRFMRPLFIRALIEGRPVGRIMVDEGSMVNVMPTSFFKKLGKSKDELKPTDTIMTDFTGSGQQAKGVLTTELTVGSKTLRTAFFVVDADSYYNLLLGRDWIHVNECVPSTLHEKLFQWIGDKVEKIRAEGRPQIVDINSEGIGHINWADIDPDEISFVRVTEEGVQLILVKDEEAMVAVEEPPSWLKWNTESQEPKL
uniref:Uncharacterized protein n=1 Tax=Ananas comosus var. bracteatus TaxID=296719 RepID=A0A6V7PL84_ANACO|nr:unnamed protein product [Ananas comosus var. bracteatus]